MKNPVNNNTMSLFSTPREQGAREWSTFNAIRGDRVGMFRVAQPKKTRGPHRPGFIRIFPKPRRFTPQTAH